MPENASLRSEGVDADYAHHEVGSAAAVEVTGEEGVAGLLEVSPLRGHAVERSGADEAEGVIRNGARIGVE